jgi:hypothetical protein
MIKDRRMAAVKNAVHERTGNLFDSRSTEAFAIPGAGKEGETSPPESGRPPVTAAQCRLYETCLAPLCPLDRGSLNGIWYSDEEICRSRTYGNLSWIRAQRKIARVKAEGYFTLEMLNDIRTARKGMAGLDPNEDEEIQLRRWMGLHEKKRSDRGKGRNKTLSLEGGRHQPEGSSARQPTHPKTGVSAPLQNVTRQGGQGKNFCRNRGAQHPNRTGTGKPPSRKAAPEKS